MEDARELWDRLIRKPWSNPDADFDFVMAELARHHSVEHLLVSDEWIAKTPYRPPFSPIPPGDQYLLDELSALALAPYEAQPWPDPPNVDLDRLVADYQRTTDSDLGLVWRYDQNADGGFWSVEITVDGGFAGGAGRPLEGDPEADLAVMADAIQDFLGEEAEGDWPRCPRHRNRVMSARTNAAGIACWVCQADPTDQRQIGQLGTETTT